METESYRFRFWGPKSTKTVLLAVAREKGAQTTYASGKKKGRRYATEDLLRSITTKYRDFLCRNEAPPSLAEFYGTDVYDLVDPQNMTIYHESHFEADVRQWRIAEHERGRPTNHSPGSIDGPLWFPTIVKVNM